MRFGRFRQFLWLVLVVTATTILPVQADQPSAGWFTDFAKAQAEAKRLGRPILLHVYADWCGPCRRMEREVLHTPELLDRLGTAVVGVKINSDHQPDLMRQFGVHALPSDVVISPDGAVLARTEGFQDLRSYLGRIAQVEGQFGRSPKVQTHVAEKPLLPEKPQVAENKSPETQTAENNAQAKEPAPSDEPAVASADGRSETWVGLGGYSPVSLSKWRKWRKGKPQFAQEHQGVMYHLATDEEFAEFQQDPGRFAPQLLGCDPVRLWETDRAVPGSTKFGAYFDNELYLFASQENRERFKQDPLRYTRTRHVLRADEIERTELR